jgi:hypothetical protein
LEFVVFIHSFSGFPFLQRKPVRAMCAVPKLMRL